MGEQDWKKKQAKGRPGINHAQKARVAALYRKKHSMRKVAEELGLGLGTVQKIIKEAELRTRVVYVFMDREQPATVIDSAAALEKVSCVNLTGDLISRAFGINEKPDWDDYVAFLESRCMPRTRYGIKEELRNLGVGFYDPFLIVEKTQGRVYEDGEWLWKLSQDQVRAYDEIMQMKLEEGELRGRLIGLLRDLRGRETE